MNRYCATAIAALFAATLCQPAAAAAPVQRDAAASPAPWTIAQNATFEQCKQQCVRKFKCHMETPGPGKITCVNNLKACVSACPK